MSINIHRAVKRRAHIAYEFLKDARRYSKYSGPLDWETPKHLAARHLEAQLTKDYHRVEKGLTLPVPRRPFGLALAARLRHYIHDEGDSVSSGCGPRDYALDTLAALSNWNQSGEIDDEIAVPSGLFRKPSIQTEILSEFFHSRRSIRNFDPKMPVPRNLLATAAEFAVNTPSVCNRQAWNVHYHFSPKAQNVLALQNGSAGFEESVPVVAVITVDLRMFAGQGERNQAWIDGGLFSMSLVWALHGLGIGTCMLNWSMSNARSKRLRSIVGLDEHQAIIMMIAIGYPTSDYRVARSPRRPVEDVAIFVNGSDSEQTETTGD